MALRWIEGFETRLHTDYFTRLYDTFAGAAISSGVTGRKHGSAISNANAQFTPPVLVSAVENTWIVQFALRKNGKDEMNTNYGVFQFKDSVGDQFEVRWVEPPAPDGDGYVFELYRGATLMATSARIFRPSSNVKGWWVFQLKVTIRTGVNGSYEMLGWDWQGNQITVFSATSSVNTANQGTDGADRVFFRNNSSGNAQFAMDDIVIMDSTGTTNNDFTSDPLIVYGELPNADVAGEIDWVPSSGGSNFALVQDGKTAPSGTGEVTSDVVGDVDLYGHSQVQLDLIPTASPPTVAGIMVDIEGQMKNTGSRTVRVRVKDSTNQADDTTDLVYDDTSKASKAAVMDENPTGTPGPWTVADLKTIELGPKNNA